ncbi:MAG: DUF5667 domain-containing protein [bacterium]|nr:DUF5667 domain-containing protein [bacterium]
MKTFSAIALGLLLIVVFSLPVSASAAEKAGIKPGSFFYGFVTTFEKVNLFFTFSPEKKAEKALRYAEKRLAEAEAVAEDENSEAVKVAIAGYEKNIALAAEASKKVKDEAKAENLLNLIAENTSKHQEVLADVLTKVPDEAKEAITKAIEASRKGQDEALKQVAELKGEIEQLKKEVTKLKEKDEEQGKINKATAPDKTTFCNGVYYTQCPSDTKFICPKTSEAYCETPSKNKSVSVSADTLICNGKEWLKCPQGRNFYCPAQGDAQCVPQPSVSTNNQVDTSVSDPNASVSNQTVEKLLQQEIIKQNSWYEEYLRKQAEIDAQLKPIHEEENRITAQYMAECLQFVTGQLASKCDQLTNQLNSLEAEASRISGIYPERKTLPKVPTPKYEQWRIDKGLDGLSGTIWSPNSTTRYRWSCINPYSCTLTNY